MAEHLLADQMQHGEQIHQRAQGSDTQRFIDEVHESRFTQATEQNKGDKTCLDPKKLEDPATMKDLLKDAAAAHEKWEKASRSETPWQEFYANYINDRVKGGVDVKGLTALFEKTGAAHHKYETEDLHGKPDEDWAGWYANFASNELRQQRSK